MPEHLTQRVDDPRTSGIEQRMLAELEKQTSALRAIRWAVWGVGVIILVAVYLVGVNVNLSPTAFRITP